MDIPPELLQAVLKQLLGNLLTGDGQPPPQPENGQPQQDPTDQSTNPHAPVTTTLPPGFLKRVALSGAASMLEGVADELRNMTTEVTHTRSKVEVKGVDEDDEDEGPEEVIID